VFALIVVLVKLVGALPGAGVLMRELRRRWDLAATEAHGSSGNASVARAFTDGSAPDAVEQATLADAMERMLRRSMDQTRSQSRRSLFSRMFNELVPDEARIVSAVADGSTYPLIEIAIAQRGGAPQTVLKNASSVGRAAGVADPALVPAYVSHLIGLGLAEMGPEDTGLDDEYQILLTDGIVQRAHREAAAGGRRAPRIIRATLRISPLGREFWAACQISHDVT
jgi:hypothetical protein